MCCTETIIINLKTDQNIEKNAPMLVKMQKKVAASMPMQESFHILSILTRRT